MQIKAVCATVGMLIAAVSRIFRGESGSLVCVQTLSFSYPGIIRHKYYNLHKVSNKLGISFNKNL